MSRFFHLYTLSLRGHKTAAAPLVSHLGFGQEEGDGVSQGCSFRDGFPEALANRPHLHLIGQNCVMWPTLTGKSSTEVGSAGSQPLLQFFLWHWDPGGEVVASFDYKIQWPGQISWKFKGKFR